VPLRGWRNRPRRTERILGTGAGVLLKATPPLRDGSRIASIRTSTPPLVGLSVQVTTVSNPFAAYAPEEFPV
jgi:hypothetical protein